MNKQLTGYAYDFISYLIGMSFWDDLNLRSIVLYGSAARGEADESSDVDLFVDAIASETELKVLDSKIRKAENSFYLSERMKKWEIKGVKNRFSILIGNLQEEKWSDLRNTISLYGITLWERFQAKPSGELKRYVIFSWVSKGASMSERVNLCRRMYGYKVSKTHYPGLLQSIEGRRLSDGVVMVPAEHSNKVRSMLRELKMKYSLLEVFMQ